MAQNKLTAFVVYMALVGGNFVPYHLILPVRIAHHVLLTIGLLYVIGRYGLPTTPLTRPLVIFVGVLLFSTAFSIDPRMAMENVWHWIINILLFLMMVSWFRRGYGKSLFNGYFGVAGVIIAICLLQALLAPQNRVSGPFMLINLTGAYAAALVVPTHLWAREQNSRILMSLACGLIFVILANQSRGALISVAIAYVAFIAFQYPLARLFIPVVGFISAMLFLAVIALSNQSSRIDGDTLRLDLWHSALEMIQARPITGVGPGLFGQAYRSYRTLPGDNMTGAHNLYLNTGAELGILGILAGVWIAVSFLRALPRERTTKQNAVLATLAGIAVHLLFDNFPTQNFVFLIGTYAAYLVAYSPSTVVNYPRQTSWLRYVAFWLIAVYGLILLRMDYAQSFYERSLAGDVAAARVAVQLDPDMRLYQLNLARLENDESQVVAIDPTILTSTNWPAYAVVNFARYGK